ncbi:MAG: hypothetical protein R3C11_11730 [Planctomycetaceae bacterium]
MQDLTTPDPAQWSFVEDNRPGSEFGYSANSTGAHSFALQLTDELQALPEAYSLSAKLKFLAQAGAWQDGFLIFDYKNENDFKYAGVPSLFRTSG